MDTEHVSAFAAYQTDTTEEPAAPADISFRNLSRNEMIAHLISKKKNELKRKKNVSESLDDNPKKSTKRNKKGASKSAPVSQNNSISPKESAVSNEISPDRAKPAKVFAFISRYM